MKTWKHKVKIPKWGICTVKEATDRKASRKPDKYGYIAPRSHGFVNLYQGQKRLGWCGYFFASERIVK